MAVGKNKKLNVGGKKGNRKKVSDPFQKKEWYDIKAPTMFDIRNCAKTLVTKSSGTKISSDGLKGRIMELNLADLQSHAGGDANVKDEDQGFKKVKLCIEDVQNRNCLTDFHGLNFTRDKMCYMVRKGQSKIMANLDVKTMDGYTVRLFCVGFTTEQKDQLKSHCYAQTSQIRRIRKIMRDIIHTEASKGFLRDLVKNLIANSMEAEITKKTSRVFPLKNVHIYKCKVLRKPKFDITKLMELHKEGAGDGPAVMLRAEEEEAQNTLAAEMAEDDNEEED